MVAQASTDAPHKPDAVHLGLVSLEAAPGWHFFPLGDRVVARPAERLGVFQVRPLPSITLPKPVTHEVCMAVAMTHCGHVVSGPGLDPARDRVGRCVIGGESFPSTPSARRSTGGGGGSRGTGHSKGTGGTFVRVYYHHGPHGFIVGSFSCKAARAADRSVRHCIRDCDAMMHTLRAPPPPGS